MYTKYKIPCSAPNLRWKYSNGFIFLSKFGVTIDETIFMKPQIDSTAFGSITIEGQEYHHDVLIRVNGKVEKRKKKLSKLIFGTSHILSLDEVKFIYEVDARKIIIGTGQYGELVLSDEARAFLESKCEIAPMNTRKAIVAFNQCGEKVIGLFHVTC
jgi:hypothetical protein